MRVQVVSHDPVVLVIRLFGVTQYETTLVDMRRADDLHAVLAQFLQRRDYPRRYRTVAGTGMDQRLGAVLCQRLVAVSVTLP